MRLQTEIQKVHLLNFSSSVFKKKEHNVNYSNDNKFDCEYILKKKLWNMNE